MEETVRLSRPDDQPVTNNGGNHGSGLHLSVEAVYQALLSLTSDLCCVVHKNGSINGINASFLKISGYAEKEVLHRLWFDFVHPQDTRKSQRLLHTKSNSGEKPTSVSYRFRKKNGRYVWLKSNSRIVPGNGQKMCIVICSQDITKEKKSAQRKHDQGKELALYKAELENFTYLASHDLQEPLRVISSYLQLLEKRYKKLFDQDGIDFINYTIDGADRMKVMIRDLLVYSRINRKYKDEEPVDMNKVLEDVQNKLKHDIAVNKAVIRADRLPTVRCNESLIVLVWQNLISNAIRFRSEKEVVITIRVKEQPKQWIIAVEDNGIGIEKKYHQKIFEPFERLHGRKYAGTGMGLAISKKILERYRGRIWINSQPGQGTTFCFALRKP